MKKLFQLMTLCLLLPLTAAAQSWNEAEYKQIEQSIRVPQFADKVYVITKYGAKVTNTAAQNEVPHGCHHPEGWREPPYRGRSSVGVRLPA